ncbi:Uncharacterised protein [Mycobacterium tuberculosis]|nr:Uncharacterised protein [Mycobacterium tuberculosis]
MHLPVRAHERVAGVFDHGFLEGEVRRGVVNRLVDDLADGPLIVRQLRIAQRIDVLDDALVLGIDLADSCVEFGFPYEMRHDFQR